MPYLDLDAVIARLFAQPAVIRRVQRDYEIPSASPAEMATVLLQRLAPPPNTLQPGHVFDNADVFRAAVLALASNSRTWASVLRQKARLEELLAGFDPSATASRLASGTLVPADFASCLPGQTSSADAGAIAAWAHRLATGVPYHAGLCGMRDTFARDGAQPDEVLPMVAIAHGSSTPSVQRTCPRPEGLETWKAPGMGAVLASEFLRNLGWSGFKPDRHIKRLLARWFPDVVADQASRAHTLASKLGTSAKDPVEFLTFSLAGAAVTPPGRTFTEADGLVWALGAYVEGKGRESSSTYRVG